jgi:2-polyprenyl-6-methoxyphenol hydroxylase-like FAD-dependent oxidoreductase
MEEVEFPVVVVGAGPVGLSLALGLARHGVRSVVLEKETALQPHSRAVGVLPRTLEIFRAWGVLEQFLAAGELLTRVSIYRARRTAPVAVIDLGILSRHTATPGGLILSQYGTEVILLESVREAGCTDVRFGHTVTGFRQDASGVTVQVAPASGEAYAIRGAYLVGCDGAHSTVREQLGWELQGKTYPARILLADVRLTDSRDRLPWPRMAPFRSSTLGALRYQSQHWRIMYPLPSNETEEVFTREPVLREMVECLFGPGPFETQWVSVFRIHCRTSPHFRQERVMLAGDAAHINSPAGGQGMNSGIEDANNLAWKLARALEGGSDALLASYEQERRAAVLTHVDRYTDFLTRAVLLAHPWVRVLFLLVARGAISLPFVLERVALRAGMLDTHYGSSVIIQGKGRWLGRRAPDGDLLAPDGAKVRLLDLAARDAALLLFEDGRLPHWNREEVQRCAEHIPRLQVVPILHPDAPLTSGFRDPDGSVWRAWGQERSDPPASRVPGGGATAALVRPDGFVGWMDRNPSLAALRAGLAIALGVREVGVDDTQLVPH